MAQLSREARKDLADRFCKEGVFPNIKGFAYTIDAIAIVMEGKASSMTKELYPAVAEIHHTTASRVERAIRHCIECMFEKSTNPMILGIFDRAMGVKPTNSEFIKTVAYQLCQEE